MAKNLVVCCDGTDNEVATDSTNVLRLYRMLVRDARQMAYYDGGVGTLSDPAALTLVRKQISKWLDAAIGLHVRDNVIAAYRFLAEHFEPGDQIFLFGFSRGAYTVRALGGMIRFLGLFRDELEDLAPLAWAIYANEAIAYATSRRFAGGNRFNRCFGVVPKPLIHFLGVWDTVSSYGWFWDFQTLPYTAHNTSIANIRHALAIDERRAFFPPNMVCPEASQLASCKQVWFAGVHGDVGAGYPEAQSSLAKVPLAWMLREAEALGLLIDQDARQYFINSPQKPPPDACGPIHESLTARWWPMEFLPRNSWDETARRMRWHLPNFGRRRTIASPCVIHNSVVDRMKRTGYRPANLPEDRSIEP